MPLCQKVKREIDGDERGAGRPKPGARRSEPVQARCGWSGMSCEFMRAIFIPALQRNDMALCFEFKPA